VDYTVPCLVKGKLLVKLLGKLDELKLLIHESGLDIIGIAETWLGEEVGNVEIRIEGYKIYRKDRSQIKHEKRGGVLLYVKNDIVTCDCGDLNKIQAESIWCKIVDKMGKGTEIVVGVCYKRPAAEAKEIE
jgi:hypothetical protein